MNQHLGAILLNLDLPEGALALLFDIVAERRLGNTVQEVATFFLMRSLDDYARAHSTSKAGK